MLSIASAVGAAAGDEEPPIPIDTAAEAELLAVVGDGFAIRRTPHFVIVHNTSDEVLDDFLRRAERTYQAIHRFCKAGEIPVTTPESRLAVFFFETPEEFVQYGESIGFSNPAANGVFSIYLNRSAFYNTLKSPRVEHLSTVIDDLSTQLSDRRRLSRGQRRSISQRLHTARNQRDRYVTHVNQLVVQHEVTHQTFYNIGVHTVGAQNPTWLVEGLACLFETPPTSTGSGFGTINQMRLRDFRSCLTAGSEGDRPQAANLRYAYLEGRFVPLRELTGEHDRLARGDRNIVYHYAQSWALVHYLQRRYQKAFAAYIHALAQRKPGVTYTREQEIDAFEAAFGPIDEMFERRWVEYILELPYRPGRIGG